MALSGSTTLASRVPCCLGPEVVRELLEVVEVLAHPSQVGGWVLALPA
jgi:hypothetical protein